MNLTKNQHLIFGTVFVIFAFAILFTNAASGIQINSKNKISSSKAVKPIPFVTWGVKEILVGEQNGKAYNKGELVMWHVVIHYTNNVVPASPVIPPNAFFYLRSSQEKKCNGTQIEPTVLGPVEGSEATFIGSFTAPVLGGTYYVDACKLSSSGIQHLASSYFYVI